jgi:streptomycin 3"-adenylyltransferase
MTDEMPLLLDDISTDTANVLLTLARVWFTLATGDFASKDEAADWAIERLAPGEAAALERARDTYRAGTYESWDFPTDAASVTAATLVRLIERLSSSSD